MAINHVSISGNLTGDPIKRGAAENPILNFSVAVNDRRRNAKTGEWEDYPNYIDCVLFGKRAVSLSNILCKGMKVAIDGELRWSQWEKDGQKRSKVDVIVDEIVLMAAPKEEQKGESPW